MSVPGAAGSGRSAPRISASAGTKHRTVKTAAMPWASAMAPRTGARRPPMLTASHHTAEAALLRDLFASRPAA